MTTIWIDADAAPRPCKDFLFGVAERWDVEVVLVANQWQRVPRNNRVTFVQVSKGLDVADDHIVAHCGPGDLVITNDLPLAAEVLDKGAHVIRPRGQVLDAGNIRQQLSMRDFLDELRGAGVTTGGPPPYKAKDKERFANAVDHWLTRSD